MTQTVEEPQTNLPIAEKINPLDPVPDLPQENKSTWHVKTSLILHLLTIKKRTEIVTFCPSSSAIVHVIESV